MCSALLSAQSPRDTYFGLTRPAPPAPPPAARKLKVRPPNNVPSGEVLVGSTGSQERDGPVYHLRGSASIETDRFLIRADEIDYNEETQQAEARGHVYLLHFEGGEELWAERAEYDVGEETGRFYEVRGSAPVHIDARSGVLSSSNPFYFEGRWAEKLKDRYILYNGFITNCRMPSPWWKLRASKFDVIPNDRAYARNSIFQVRSVPIFFTPFFRKSLERLPRQSGFLTPNAGNSSRRGKMFGVGYYWAISRSYDASYRSQYFTQRGFAHTIDFRGKPNDNTQFDAYFYGVNDRGLKLDDGRRIKEGGFLFSFRGRSELGSGWYARGEANYLTSITFRQAFTETFNEAVFYDVHSVGYISKDWSTYNLDFAAERTQSYRFEGFTQDETVTIRKLPEANFMSRDRRIFRDLPLWVSWESSAGLVRRKQPLFQTRQFLERMDLYPRVMTVLRWKDISIVPSFAIRESHWGESRQEDRALGRNINRHGQEVTVAIVPPSLERVYDGPGWLGEKVKHVIEPRVSFRHVRGIDQFDQLIRFDETELYSNTTEAEASITNRLYAKRRGNVEEVLSWQLWQRRYFDPDFGGAVTAGRRNIVLSGLDLTPYAFLDRPRHYSPIVSVLRLSPKPGFAAEWRADYDPLRARKFTNSSITGDARFGKYFVSVGHSVVRRIRLGEPDVNGVDRLLTPAANQFRGMFGIGHDQRRGWNAAFSAFYDFRVGLLSYATTQVTYNTDCCGFSVQYRRLNLGPRRSDDLFRVAFAVANIGSFGTLKKQERIF